MFLLELYNHVGIYSTKELAEKNSAAWLRQHVVVAPGCEGAAYDSFINAFQQEKYTLCVDIWNTYAINRWMGQSLYRVKIKEIVLNASLI